MSWCLYALPPFEMMTMLSVIVRMRACARARVSVCAYEYACMCVRVRAYVSFPLTISSEFVCPRRFNHVFCPVCAWYLARKISVLFPFDTNCARSKRITVSVASSTQSDQCKRLRDLTKQTFVFFFHGILHRFKRKCSHQREHPSGHITQ